MNAQQGPPVLDNSTNIDQAIRRSINLNDAEFFLTEMRKRFAPSGERDQDDVVSISYDTLMDLLVVAELSYRWAQY